MRPFGSRKVICWCVSSRCHRVSSSAGCPWGRVGLYHMTRGISGSVKYLSLYPYVD